MHVCLFFMCETMIQKTVLNPLYDFKGVFDESRCFFSSESIFANLHVSVNNISSTYHNLPTLFQPYITLTEIH